MMVHMVPGTLREWAGWEYEPAQRGFEIRAIDKAIWVVLMPLSLAPADLRRQNISLAIPCSSEDRAIHIMRDICGRN